MALKKQKEASRRGLEQAAEVLQQVDGLADGFASSSLALDSLPSIFEKAHLLCECTNFSALPFS